MSKKTSENNVVSNSALVVTSNDLVLAKYNFSLWQKRVFNYFVSQIDKDAREFMMQRVYISDLIRFFNAGDGKEVYDIITNIPKQLYNLSLKIPYVTEEGFHRYGEMRIVTRYTKPEDREPGNAYIEFKFNDDLKPHLLELKRRFSKYDLNNIVGLQSTHSIRMFEILKSYEYQGEVRLEVEYLKTVLELGDKYKLYADFRRYVIERSKEDLDRYCDISFEYREIKKSRKVDEIHFTIKRNNNLEQDESDSKSKEKIIADKTGVGERLPNEFIEVSSRIHTWWGVSTAEFAKRTKGKSLEDIEAAIHFTKEKIKEGKAHNPAGIFLEALTKGFKTYHQHHNIKQEQKKALKVQMDKLKKEYETLHDELSLTINNQVRHIVESDPSVTHKAIAQVIVEFEATKRSHLVADKTVEDFRQNPLLREAVIEAIKKMYPQNFVAIEQSYHPRLEGLKKSMLDIVQIQNS